MANEDTSFPKIADSSWWKLRDLFKRKVPTIVTPTYLASALSMSEASAKSNLIGPFKKIGIIDDDGKPTDLAYDWRDDHKYQSVCTTLIDKFYPQEIKDLFHSPNVDLQQLSNWFMSQARCGAPAAKMYARFYLLLLRAAVEEGTAATVNKTPKAKGSAKKKTFKPAGPQEIPDNTVHQQKPVAPAPPIATVLSNSPELHINIQLHISPETSAEQIDKIFESMAKHLKIFNK